jgi:carbon monoxide dehydrogenase subunit G
MRLQGAFEVAASRWEVYGFLTDWSRVAPVLPDVTSYEVHDADTVSLDARVGVPNVRGTMRSRFTIVDREPDRRARYRGRASGLGSSLDLEVEFALEDAGEGTEVRWAGTANVLGRLASVPGGLLEPIARRNLTAFVEAVRAALDGTPAAE